MANWNPLERVARLRNAKPARKNDDDPFGRIPPGQYFWSQLGMKWEGVPFSEIAKLAKPKPEAKFVMEHSYGGYTTNVPLDELYDDDVLIAYNYELLLKSEEGGSAIAHSEGLVSFLGNQDGLQLVFINGCSSKPQASDLLEAGVPAVIGTSQPIVDETFLQIWLSRRFRC